MFNNMDTQLWKYSLAMYSGSISIKAAVIVDSYKIPMIFCHRQPPISRVTVKPSRRRLQSPNDLRTSLLIS